jgi:hypothetical protein
LRDFEQKANEPAPPEPTTDPVPATDPVPNGASTAESLETSAKPSFLGGFARGVTKLGVGIIVNYVTTKISVGIVEGNKFQQEQNTLNQANHVASQPEDAKRRDLEETILGGFPVPFLNIAAAGLARFATDTMYDMVQGERERQVNENPDMPPDVAARMDQNAF